jgi:hypothetical protein
MALAAPPIEQTAEQISKHEAEVLVRVREFRKETREKKARTPTALQVLGESRLHRQRRTVAGNASKSILSSSATRRERVRLLKVH